jgi:hypothetical protein
VFTARYGLSPYIKQIRFVFKGLKSTDVWVGKVFTVRLYWVTDSALLNTVMKRGVSANCVSGTSVISLQGQRRIVSHMSRLCGESNASPNCIIFREIGENR